MSGAWVRRARLAASLGRPMPTKQVMSLRRARAAVMLIISEEVNSVVISGGSFLEYVLFQPVLEQLPVTGDAVPVLVEGVVPLVVAQRVRGRRAPLCHGDGGDGPAGDDAGVNRGTEVIDDFFHSHDAALGRQYGFLLHPDNALDQHVALAVSTLGVDDGDIRAYRRYRRQAFAGEGAFDESDLVVDHGQIAADVTAQHSERQASRASFKGVGHGGMAVLAQLQRARPARLP